jgi:4-amino-4-deoxy-L-arabinose transferase-like glycosyltransferase
MKTDIIKKFHLHILGILLFLLIYFLYFHNLWAYKLLDMDETRYVDMARCMHNTKDFLTLYLNGEYFFEKPPLYFWLLNISFYVFNTINEFTARIPACLAGIFAGFVLFFGVKKYTDNLKLALFSSIILLSSAEFIALSKISILDIFLSSFTTIAIIFGFLALLQNDKKQKYYWWLFYSFTAFAVLAKGIPGIALPFATMFFAGCYTKKIKTFFAPQNFFVGIFIFLLIAIPWHVAMLHKYPNLFYNEYIIKHHIARFLGSSVINRERPFWFYIPVIIVGICPFTTSFIAMISEKIYNLKNFKYTEFINLDRKQQFLNLCIIASLVIFLFFSSSGTKLVTYILPIYPFLSVLLANYWLEYIDKSYHFIEIKISSLIFYSLFIIAGFGFIIAEFLFIPEPLKSDLHFLINVVFIVAIIIPILGIIALFKEAKMKLFISYILFITTLSGFGFHKILETDYKFGQNDLIEYAKYAKDNDLNIFTFQTGHRYSLLYYSQKNVKFDIAEDNPKEFLDILNNPKNIIIVRKKNIENIPTKNYKIIKEGRKYLLIEKKNGINQ